jgi:hypothetical protein
MATLIKRALLGFLFLFLIAGPVQAESITVATQPVPLDFKDLDRKTVGDLTYRGGIKLDSDAERFGGFSAISVDDSGRKLTAISDQGYALSATLEYDDAGHLSGMTAVRYWLLPGLAEQPDETWRDAEGLAIDGAAGSYVSFEREHRIWLYKDLEGDPVPFATPPGIEETTSNSGMEAMTLLNDGRLLVFSERLHAGPGVTAWIQDGAGGDWQQLIHATSQGYQPTGAATLPNGDVLVLERRFPPISVRLRRISEADIAPGAVVDGAELARIEGSLVVDNYEGIAVRHGANGETLVYLMSDDNLNPIQETYLLMFALAE